ncbi:MAG: NACHT domain-containing protein, partial [Bacteroidetes bacterium]|nr:NACHT domain-containing protein [Bacteroidota bacterium]
MKLREEIISKNSDFKFKEGYSGGPILHSRSGSVLAMLTAVFKNNSDHLVIEGAKGITSDDIYTLLGDYLPPLERSPDRIGLLTGARRFFSKLDYDPEKTFTLKVISKDFNALISIKDIFNFRYEDKEEEEDGKKKSSMHPMLSLGYWLAPNPRGNRWRHLVLINKGGCGKTTSLMELTEYLQKEKWKDRPIPIFIPLRDCRSSSGGYRSFLDYIQEKFRLEIPVNTLKNWMQEAGPQKHFPKALLILDGYDELPSEHISYFHREISEGLREWPDVQLILSCRPEFQPPFTQDSHSFIQLSLAGLKYSDFDYWLDNELSSLPKYHSQKIKQYLSIQDNEKGWSESEKIFREFLLSSPMILSVFLEVIRDTPLEKAETIENSWLQLNNTGIVLEQYIRQRLEKHKVTAGLDHNDHSELEPVLLEWFYHHFLPYLAFSFPSIDCLGIEIWIKGYSAFLKSIDLQYFLRSFPDQKTHIKRFSANKDRWQQLVSEKLQEKLEHSGLFDEDEFTYHFKHNQIRSYFFARHLCNELLLFGNSSQLPPSWQKKIYPEEICRLVMEILSVNEKKDHLYRLFDLLRGQASE